MIKKINPARWKYFAQVFIENYSKIWVFGPLIGFLTFLLQEFRWS